MCHPELSRLLGCLNVTPGDGVLWLAVADWLEENGEPLRAELVRLNRRLREMDQASRPRQAAESRIHELIAAGVRPCVPEITNGVGMRFALIPPGTFWMGSPPREAGREHGETRHQVTLTRPFWMGVYPVTQAQYHAVMGRSTSRFTARAVAEGVDTAAFPADSVTWRQAVSFCKALARHDGELAAGHSYRLPTEAEWEYACRAGLTSGRFHTGNALRKTDANFDRTGLERPCPVGQYPPNAWGLHDMHGNICEWCSDWSEDDYPEGPASDPRGPSHGPNRVLRGGSWEYPADSCRTACRDACGPTSRNWVVGFRVVRVPAA